MDRFRRWFTARNGWLFLFCAFLAWITYHLKVATTTAWTDGSLEWVHKQLVALDYVNNEQSRVLQYAIPQTLSQLTGITVRSAYMVQRLVFTTLALLVFTRYCRHWLRPGTAVAGTVLYALLIAYSARNDLQESAPLLGLTFAGALWAMREGRDIAFAAIVWIGALNNETMLFLIPLFVLIRAVPLRWDTLWRMSARAFILGLPALLTVAAVRYLTRDMAYLGGGWHLGENLRSLGAVVLFFGPLWLLALWRMRDLPLFLRRGLWSVPLFMLPNLMIGVITETRLLLPLCGFVLPAALWTWLPEERSAEQP